MKRNRAPSTSEESDNGSNCTSWSQMSNSQRRRDGKRPSEVFRTDLITAMKLHDSYQLNPEDYYVLSDSWRQEWEKGVQVPVSPNSIPKPIVRTVAPKSSAPLFTRPKKLIRSWGAEASGLGYVGIGTLSEGTCRYDLNEEDVYWLEEVNKEFTQMGMPQLDENTMEKVMEEFERRCYDNMSHAIETEEGLGIEYDEDVVCDVCQSPDGEDGNEMVFCDKCNICVHQACYGILKVPEGSWLCRTCALGISPKCQLCPKKGGAMKPTRSGSKWVHVSCALWIPEVSIGNPEKMEPITSVSQIPNNRWALICCLCKEKTGACIQCSAKSCRVAFHVTCGLQFNLKMNTILTEDDEVKFKSFCPTHSGLDWPDGDEGGGGGGARGGATTTMRGGVATLTMIRDGDQSDGARLSQRKLRLQQLEDEFYRYASPDEVANQMRLSAETVDFLFQYWKLKRKANFNQPLVTPKREEEESLARREQEVLLRRLRLFTHLRQDLERVRNLTYMVTRREKIKRSVCRVQEQIFHHHVRLLEQGRLSGVSSTRRLEEALFYFRATPPSSTSSLQPLRGHTQNGAAHVSPKRSFQRHGALKRSHHGDGQHLDHANSEATGCRGQHCDGVRTAKPHPPEEEEEEEKLRRRRKKRKRRWVWEQKLASKVVVEAEGASPIDNVPKNSDAVVHSGYNGSLRRTNPGQQGASPGNNKSWGNFRIPKRTAGMGPDEADGRDFTSSGPVTSLDANPAPKPTPPIRTRLRTGAEPRPLATEQKKRCHAQRLRNHHPIAQRYGSEVLRCGVLAS